MRIHVKENVIICFTPTVLHIIAMWEKACERAISMSYIPELTSGMDGTHSRLSGHYEGRSLDFSSKSVRFELRQNLKAAAQELLGPDYLVLLEDTHYHIQRDKHRPFEFPKSVEI